jgi:hypothetical protein
VRTTNLILICCALLGGPLVAVGSNPATPNIVFIFIDDMGYADIAPFNNTQVRTPHLDTLAQQGRKFTSYYAEPVCSMSRASLMTGCYNVRGSLSPARNCPPAMPPVGASSRSNPSWTTKTSSSGSPVRIGCRI